MFHFIVIGLLLMLVLGVSFTQVAGGALRLVLIGAFIAGVPWLMRDLFGNYGLYVLMALPVFAGLLRLVLWIRACRRARQARNQATSLCGEVENPH